MHDPLDPAPRLEILKTPGMVRILGSENGPAPVPESQIESIKTILAGKSAVCPVPYLKEGQLVRVVYGPLKGSEGFLLKIKGKREKLVISVDLLQRLVAVEIDGASALPLPSSSDKCLQMTADWYKMFYVRGQRLKNDIQRTRGYRYGTRCGERLRQNT